ncbi:MAG: T9SS type A sorting domain-containing protein, partial [Candidatus Electryoneaceae bacterium]|nr:T9SS type A sorting domain-containing protein [Candidatus Electryoneaceae bacterium]
EVRVTDPEEDVNVAGAQVTIYVPGDMPAYDHNDYPDYDDMQMWTKQTDEEGMARFVFDDVVEFENRSEMNITITGRDIYPVLEEIDIEVPRNTATLAVGTYNLEEVEGNEDNDVNPGEVFSFNLIAENIGDEEATGVTALISSISPYLSIEEDNEIDFHDIDAHEESEGDRGVEITISPVCPDGETRPITRPVILVDFRSGEELWQSAIKLTPVAPNFELRAVVGGIIIDTDREEIALEIDINNVGGLNANGITAELKADGLGIVVIDGSSHYPNISSGSHRRTDDEPFNISGNRIAIPGSICDMMIIFRAENDFVDTAFFNLQVDEPRADVPQGPDGYGYICFDDTDDDWDMAPDYDWFEISPDDRNYDEEGTACDFDGNSPSNIGETDVVDLPFNIQFYGKVYDEITIATNGFISVGDQEYVTNYQNWPMDRAIGGGVGMIAPLWDDLRLTGDGQVYYYYDEHDARFIVEWYELRHRSGGNTDLTFQVILYDMDVWVTETGDPNIVIQYKSIENARGRAGWNTAAPYASVGISSPDGTTGINYSYNNEYPVTSAHLENQRALLFATSPKYRAGILYGVVTDARTEEPIPEAVIITEHGLATRTDADGYYRIANALAEVDFDIITKKFAYNDSSLTDMMVEEDDSLEINFALLHPEFEPSQREFQAMLDPDLEEEFQFSLTNDGNGPLDWTLRKRLPNDADVDPWEHRESFFVGDSVEDTRIKGVVYAGDQFYCTGGGNEINYIYIFDRDGVPIDRFEQFTDSRYGMSDLAWDGSLLWGIDGQTVYGFTTEGEVQVEFEAPYNPTTAIVWDPDRQILWMSGIVTRNIMGYNRDGQEMMRAPRQDFRIYGFSYWLDDPDGYPLYIFHKVGASQQTVHKMNPDNGDTMFVSIPIPPNGGKPEGAFITNQYDVYSWVFMGGSSAGSDDGGDRIDLWQLEARRDWYRVYPSLGERVETFAGRIEAGETHDFTLFLNSWDLPRVPFVGELLFRHNAAGGADTLHVVLDVIGGVAPSPFSLVSPENESSFDGNNEETEVTFVWNESDDPHWGDIVRYQLWLQSGTDSISFGLFDTTSFTIDDMEELELLLEQEPLDLTWWVNAVSDPDVTPSTDRFTLHYTPVGIDPDQFGIPVEFGLESIYPSPFNSVTTIRFGMDRADRVLLRVYDVSGREVALLFNEVAQSGHHSITWDASDLASGVFIVQLESAGRVRIAKVALIK